jgi:hypothetical protein
MSLRMARRKWAKMTYAERAAEDAARAAAELLFYPTFRTALAAGLPWEAAEVPNQRRCIQKGRPPL